MAVATIRLGKISSINYKAGKARVTYEDRDDSVTSELPFLAWQYYMPKVSDLVVVACFSNGSVAGVILGPIWSPANTPHKAKAGTFRQEMSTTKNKAVIAYDEQTKKVTIRAPFLEFEAYEYEDKPLITLEQLNDALGDIDDNKHSITTLFGIMNKTEGKSSLQEQIDELDKRLKAIGG